MAYYLPRGRPASKRAIALAPAGERTILQNYFLASQSQIKTGQSGRPANPFSALDGLIEALMEPVGWEARRQAATAIRQADR